MEKQFFINAKTRKGMTAVEMKEALEKIIEKFGDINIRIDDRDIDFNDTIFSLDVIDNEIVL